MRANVLDSALHYFPSYEIVTDVFADRFAADRRHVKPEILDFVMACFERFFCEGDERAKAHRYYTRLAKALAADGQARAAEEALQEVGNVLS
jgi:hypothetical protein